jgi:hypothetical protein
MAGLFVFRGDARRMAQRLMVFIDYQNVYKGARSAFSVGPPDQRPHVFGQVRPLAVAAAVRAGRTVEQVSVYRGMPSSKHDPKGFGACERQVAAWRAKNINVVTRPLNYREPHNPKEKGIDVRLAIDFVMKAMRDEYDVGILFSGDTDLLPAAEAVLELKGPGSVEFAAWLPGDGRAANRLRALDSNGKAAWCHLLDERVYKTTEDLTDYNKKAPRSRSPRR